MSASPEELVKALSAFDPRDLAAGVGALQLLPENADHLLRLERLAGMIAALPTTGKGRSRMSSGRWRTLINSPPIADSFLVSNEDPFEEPYTESISFHGGSYTVLPGLTTGAAGIVRRLTEALFVMDSGLDPDFVRTCGDFTQAVLILADTIAARSQLGRAVAPVRGRGCPAIIPPSERFQELKGALRWQRTDLEGLIGGGVVERLRQLVVPAGRLPAPAIDQSFDNQPAVLHPVLDFDDEIVVVLPTSLLTALRHWIVVDAKDAGLLDQLAHAYRSAVNRNVGRSLWIAGFRPVEVDLPVVPSIVQNVWKFDHDKLAHVVVVTDPLDGYSAVEPFGHWSDNSLSERVEEALLGARRKMREERGAGVGVLHLVVLDGIGRWVHLGLTDAASDERAYCLTATSGDLEVISRREVGDPLAVWKFARAADRLRDQTRVFQWSTLDEYAIYLDHGRSFYLGDDRRPDFLNIENASATELRVDDAVGFDSHAVLHPLSQRIVHVQRRYERTQIPIYATDVLAGPVDLFLESMRVRIWIVSDTNQDPPYQRLSSEFKEAVAYWLWQILDTDTPFEARLAAEFPQLVVELTILEGSAWFDSALKDDRAWVTVRPSARGLIITFAPSTPKALDGPDNRGERELVAELVRAIRGLVGETRPSDSADLIEVVAPLGQKKMVTMIANTHNSALMPGDLPRPRLVDDADVAVRLDELGEWLAARRPTGTVPSDGRVSLLNDVVDYYFSRLRDAVALLSPTGLVEWLIQHDESLLRDEAQRRLTLPTRIACFGLEEQVRVDLTERLPKLVVSAVASRFLIEFVAAQPPKGTEQITNERYDELMSISAEIINKGHVSDAIHFGLSDIEVSVLRSGRLGLSRDDSYQKALERFRPINVATQMDSALERFAEHWPAADGQESGSEYLDELQSAFLAEFGLTLSESAEFVGTVIDVGARLEGDAKKISLPQFYTDVAEGLGWGQERVAKVLDRFALVERRDFLAGPLGEVYPWRYGRELSYLRRPFVIVSCADSYVIWGSRHLDLAGRTLVDVCLTGRLKAKSAEMKRFMGTIRSREPERFNDAVAAAFEDDPRLIVKPRVKKIGKLKIARANGDDIGDLDVLVANPGRRRLLAVETKDFEIARTPSELYREIDKLVSGPKSANRLHSERVEWLRDHRREVLDWLGVGGSWKKWTVSGLIVVSTELMSPLLASSRFPIITLKELLDSGNRWR